jgi:hypothetical protein
LEEEKEKEKKKLPFFSNFFKGKRKKEKKTEIAIF